MRWLLLMIGKAAASAAAKYALALAVGYTLGRSPRLRRWLAALAVAALVTWAAM